MTVGHENLTRHEKTRQNRADALFVEHLVVMATITIH
jgi:hypothetical protein